MNRTNICKNIVQSIKDYITDQVKLEPHRVEKHFVENFKSKFHRPLMRWNLLLHEWSLIFHIFVLCS